MKLLCMVGWFEQGSLGFADSHLFTGKPFARVWVRVVTIIGLIFLCLFMFKSSSL